MHLPQEPYLQLRKPKELFNRGTLQDITIIKRHCMKSSTPETQCAECICQKHTIFVLLTLQIKFQGQANHDTTFENS